MAKEPDIWAVIPVLATTDVMKTAAYYRDTLGFAIDDTCYGADWAMLWADQCQLYLSLNPAAAKTAGGQQVSICVPGVDALYEKHKASGANIISDLEDKPWGLREYTVEDPNGYHLRFQAHIETSHFKDFDRDVAPWIEDKSVATWTLLD